MAIEVIKPADGFFCGDDDGDGEQQRNMCGMRIHLSKRKAEGGGAPEPTAVNAVMAEAEDQNLTSSPNQSLLALGRLLYASNGEPGLANFASALLAPEEAEGRGFAHTHGDA